MTAMNKELAAVDALTANLDAAHGIAAVAAAAALNEEEELAPINLYRAMIAIVDHLRQVRDAWEVIDREGDARREGEKQQA